MPLISRRKLLIAAPALIGLTRKSAAVPRGGGGTFVGGSLFPAAVAAISPGNWGQVSLNNFSDVWTPPSEYPAFNVTDPSGVIDEWAAMCWDSKREHMLFFGGGHAGWGGNDVYRWNSTTLKWERCNVPSQFKNTPVAESAEGYLFSPTSTHAYWGNVYLPVLDKMAAFGGAQFGTGGYFRREDNTQTGPYFFDPALADPRFTTAINGQKVGGTANSDPLGTAPAGNMWQNRNNLDTIAAAAGNMGPFNAAFYQNESGADVVYLLPGSGSGGLLSKYKPSALGPASDSYSVIGSAFNLSGPIAYNPAIQCMMVVADPNGTLGWGFWNLTQPTGNTFVSFTPTDNTGGLLVGDSFFGLDFDTVNQRFTMIGSANRRVLYVNPPSPLSANGWTITASPAPTSATPGFGVQGICGLWKYIAKYKCFVYAAENHTTGTIWVYVPHA